MNWRTLSASDILPCYELGSRNFAYGEFRGDPAISGWKQLTRRPGFYGVVIEEGPVLLGFGSSCFVDDHFVERWIDSEEVGLNARVVQSLSARKSVVLSEREICAEHSGGGLNVLILSGRWNPVSSADQIKRTRRMLESSFAELHAGYHFKRMICELTDEQDVEFAAASRLWRIVRWASGFEKERGRQRRALAVIEKKDVSGLSGSILGELFERKEPRLRLRASDQALLLAALSGGTDQEITESLGISLAAVKRRWASLFGRLQQNGSDGPLSEAFGMASDDGRRGYQKRHKILAYVRRHPEELRPFMAARVEDRTRRRSAKFAVQKA